MPFHEESRWDRVKSDLRSWWEKTRAATGERWEDVQERFRFGFEAGQKPENRERRWEDVSGELRKRWEQGRHRAEETWENVVDYVKEGYLRAKRETRSRR